MATTQIFNTKVIFKEVDSSSIDQAIQILVRDEVSGETKKIDKDSIGGQVNYGTDGQVPYMNPSGTGFLYSQARANDQGFIVSQGSLYNTRLNANGIYITTINNLLSVNADVGIRSTTYYNNKIPFDFAQIEDLNNISGFVPLTGTEENKPITGTIKTENILQFKPFNYTYEDFVYTCEDSDCHYDFWFGSAPDSPYSGINYRQAGGNATISQLKFEDSGTTNVYNIKKPDTEIDGRFEGTIALEEYVDDTVNNSKVNLSEGTNISITGTYPNLTINSTGGSGVLYGSPENIPFTNNTSDGYNYDSGFSYKTNRLNSGKPIVFSDGSINVDNMDVLSSSSPGMLLAMTTDPTTTINNHGFSDISNISKSVNNVAYASFDAVARFTGTANYNHYVGYQSRMNHAGSGTISNIYGFYDQPNISGIITNRMGLRVNDYTGTGTVGANYGVLIGSLTKGANNWSIYTADAPSDFGGYVMGRNNFVRYAPLFSTVYNPAFYYSSTSSPTGQIILSKLINSSPLPNSTFFDIELDISSMGVSSNSYQGTVRITFYYQTINSITTNGLTAKVEGTNIDKINDLINSGNIRVAITNNNELQIVLGSVGYVWGNNTAVSVKSIKMTHTGSGTALWRDGWSMALNNDNLTSTFKIVRNIPAQSTNVLVNSKANDSDVVKLSGNQTISGGKTFTNNLKFPEGVDANDGVTVGQLNTILSNETGNYLTSNSTYSLPSTNKVVYVTFTGTTSTFTLPSLDSSIGIRYMIINRGTGDITVNSNSGDDDIDESGLFMNSLIIGTESVSSLYNNSQKFIIFNS